MTDAPRKPPRLRPGDLVGVIAPATGWDNRSELLRGVDRLEAWGLRVRLGDHVNDRHGYLAGRDEDRAADLHAMLADPEVRAVICLQGGYGTPRLIPLLDEALFAANPKAICGYSDLTMLHLAAEQWGEFISFYSNGASGVGAPRSRTSRRRRSTGRSSPTSPTGRSGRIPTIPYVRTIVGGRATGRLTGGCAGLLAQADRDAAPAGLPRQDRLPRGDPARGRGPRRDPDPPPERRAVRGRRRDRVGDITTKPSGGDRDLSVEDIVEEVLGPLGCRSSSASRSATASTT